MVVARQTDEATLARRRQSYTNQAVLAVFKLGNPANKQAVISAMNRDKIPAGKGGHRTSVQNAITHGLLEYVTPTSLWLTETGNQRLWELYGDEAADILLDREMQDTQASQATLKDHILKILKGGPLMTSQVEYCLANQGIKAVYMDVLNALMDLQSEDKVNWGDGVWYLPNTSQNREIRVEIETIETTNTVIWDVAKRLSQEMPGHTPLEILALVVEIQGMLG